MVDTSSMILLVAQVILNMEFTSIVTKIQRDINNKALEETKTVVLDKAMQTYNLVANRQDAQLAFAHAGQIPSSKVVKHYEKPPLLHI